MTPEVITEKDAKNKDLDPQTFQKLEIEPLLSRPVQSRTSMSPVMRNCQHHQHEDQNAFIAGKEVSGFIFHDLLLFPNKPFGRISSTITIKSRWKQARSPVKV